MGKSENPLNFNDEINDHWKTLHILPEGFFSHTTNAPAGKHRASSSPRHPVFPGEKQRFLTRLEWVTSTWRMETCWFNLIHHFKQWSLTINMTHTHESYLPILKNSNGIRWCQPWLVLNPQWPALCSPLRYIYIYIYIYVYYVYSVYINIYIYAPLSTPNNFDTGNIRWGNLT